MTRETKKDIATGVATGTVAGGAGLAYSLNKPSLPAKRTRITALDKAKFMSKLKAGDILLSGPYKSDAWSKGFQMAVSRNQPQYHAGVYLGDKTFAELLLKNTKPSKETIQKDLGYALSQDTHKAFRPRLTEKERTHFVGRVKKNFPTYTYDEAGTLKAYTARKLGIKNLHNCKGFNCGSAIAANLPKKTRGKISPHSALPSDFMNPKHFEEVGTLEKYKMHLPASNRSLLKYVALPALAAGALGFGASKWIKKKETNS